MNSEGCPHQFPMLIFPYFYIGTTSSVVWVSASVFSKVALGLKYGENCDFGLHSGNSSMIRQLWRHLPTTVTELSGPFYGSHMNWPPLSDRANFNPLPLKTVQWQHVENRFPSFLPLWTSSFFAGFWPSALAHSGLSPYKPKRPSLA